MMDKRNLSLVLLVFFMIGVMLAGAAGCGKSPSGPSSLPGGAAATPDKRDTAQQKPAEPSSTPPVQAGTCTAMEAKRILDEYAAKNWAPDAVITSLNLDDDSLGKPRMRESKWSCWRAGYYSPSKKELWAITYNNGKTGMASKAMFENLTLQPIKWDGIWKVDSPQAFEIAQANGLKEARFVNIRVQNTSGTVRLPAPVKSSCQLFWTFENSERKALYINAATGEVYK